MTIQHDHIQFLVIDLFCGAGGVTTGIEQARTIDGHKLAKVIACINHDPLAIESHAANHRGVLHLTEDIKTAHLEPILERLEAERRRHPMARVILWASLECTNFSIAKGGLPRDADSRTLANHLFRYIKAIDPDYIMIENVKEFMSWGDLDERGKPVSKDKGRDYLRWVKTVQSFGYDFNHRLLNAADFGAHTSRIRFFGIFAKHGLAIKFPEPTHAKKPHAGMFGQLAPWKPVREVLDLEDEGKSIFAREKPLVDRTLARILAGLKKYVAGGKEAWILKYMSNNQKTGIGPGADIDNPAPTVCVQTRMNLAKVEFLQSYYGNGQMNGTDKPAPTVTTKDRLSKVSVQWIDANYTGDHHHQDLDRPCGTLTAKPQFSLMSPQWLDKYYGSGDQNHQSISQPAGAVTTNPKFALVTAQPFIAPTNYDAAPHDLDQPLGAITANRKWHYLVNPQYANTPADIDRPIFTLIARMDKKPPILITTEEGALAIRVDESDSETMRQIKAFMAEHGIIDIKMRMLSIPELKRITGFPETYHLAGNQSDQKKFIGNAVPCIVPRRMVEALHLVNAEQRIAV